MDHIIVAPAVHLGNTVGFVGSLAPEIAKERLLLIDNTDRGKVEHALKRDVYDVIAPYENIGVAASWNVGIEQAREAGAQFLTICSTSLRFRPGDRGQGLCRTADIAAENRQWRYGFESLNGWRCHTLGRKTWEVVGSFDEGFYPAYFEDSDFIYRMRCAGILEPAGGDRALRKIPWIGALEADVVATAHAIKNCNIRVDFVELEKYYERKWGGKVGYETYTVPFDGVPQ